MKFTPAQRRAALAIARAVVPKGRLVRGADEATIDKLEEQIRQMHADPRILGALFLSLDWAAVAWTARPLHALDDRAAEDLIRRWEQSTTMRWPLYGAAASIKLVHFDDAKLYEQRRVPYFKGGPAEPARWLEQVRPAAQGDEDEIECDVVVIGTGAGGGAVGKELAAKGHAVVFLEEGDLHRRDSFRGRGLEAHTKLYRQHGGIFALGNNFIPVFMGRLVGGSTAVNTGTCFRTPRWVLDEWCERLDTDAFSAEKMSTFFDRVESELQVVTGPIEHLGGVARVIARGCDKLGWKHFPLRRNAPGCDGQGVCDFGCPSGARRSTDVSYVPSALKLGAVLRTGAKVERVLVENGHAIGVRARSTKTRRTLTVRARAVVLSGGAIPSPLLLQGQGICNESGELGRNLSLHPAVAVSALFDETIEQYKSVPQGYASDQFHREGILMLGATAPLDVAAAMFAFAGERLTQVMDDYDRIATFAAMVEDESRGRVRRAPNGAPVVTYALNDEDVSKLQRGIVAIGTIFFEAGAKKLFPLSPRVPLIERRDDLDRFARTKLRASDLMLTSFHPLGTCRMGKDPRRSVVDLDHQTHAVRDLYVVDGSTVPGPPSVNPQVTIMAMATRAADILHERLS